MPHSRRIGRCAPDGDAPSPRETQRPRSCFTTLLIPKSGRRHLSSRARCNGSPRSQFACCQHVDPQTAGRVDGPSGKNDKALLAQECFPPEQSPKIFVCGSTPFVEDISRFLVELGYDPLTIKTERFGPSGGQGP